MNRSEKVVGLQEWRQPLTADVPVLVITGTMGSGKTTMLGEASDLLLARDVMHAAIDMDTLAMGHIGTLAWADLAYRNLASVWQNYLAAGAARLLLARAIENASELDRIRGAVPDAKIAVCRLGARLETMQRRVSLREPGLLRETFVARVAQLDALLDRASVEDFSVPTDDERSVTDVALEMLTRAKWVFG